MALIHFPGCDTSQLPYVVYCIDCSFYERFATEAEAARAWSKHEELGHEMSAFHEPTDKLLRLDGKDYEEAK